jgi:hypothetical protein
MCAVNEQTENAFWLARLRREVQNEPTIRDVCAACNNGELSRLDSYICKLFDETFVRIIPRDETILFSFDYHLLKRWLLKMSFNSARIHNSMDKEALELLLPYILGNQNKLGRSVQVFVQLTFPEKTDESTLADSMEGLEDSLFEPTMNRVGHMFFEVDGVGKKLLRTVHLRSFSFYIAYWPQEQGRSEQDEFERIFTGRMRSTMLLRASQIQVNLTCNGMGAWKSFSESRSGEFKAGAGD